MNNKFHGMAVACGLLLAASAVQAQETIIKVGVTRYQTHAKTTGITGIGVPAGADADVGSATTVIFVGERLITPNIGVELVLGVPPTIKSRAAGSVYFLGEVLEAKNVAPTLLLNYHFGREGDSWRPYVGAGINYTRFTGIKSSLAEHVEMSDSVGPTVQAGIDYLFSKNWGAFASVAAVKVKSDLVAQGSTVLKTTIDFRPIVYSAGLSYRF
ncbi:OmpW/AlkL family protein [Aquabacterium humicola]|uniref:OmpW/AlkL family protein n=1 Tax=Aquabacterium humicola TaxID=3237377 RepID=UPI002542B5BD|nr:OmpW family outer membrane protein [Rubrivivax pictus]